MWKDIVPKIRGGQRLSEPHTETVKRVLSATADVLSQHEPGISPRVRHLASLLERSLKQEHDTPVLHPSVLMTAYNGLAETVRERDLLSLMTTFLGSALYGADAKLCAENSTLGQTSATVCPECGQRPHYAAYGFASGTKVFECPLCYTRWQHTRIKCPGCGNLDAETMGYFLVEGLNHCRVQFCSICRTYHKVFDFREVEGENHVLYLHHLASLLCDTMACREGFAPCSGLWWNDALPSDKATDGEGSI